MTSLHRFPIPRPAIPLPGTPAGDAARDFFLSQLIGILGDVRLLFLPGIADTTTSVDESVNARTITHSESLQVFDTPPAAQGSGVAITYNGTDEEADVPDAADLSFGNATLDEAFSICALVQVSASAAIKEILTKYDLTTGVTKREWRFHADAAEKVNFILYDESVPASIGRMYNTALTADTWMLLVGTYDGTRVAGGVRVFLYDGTTKGQVDDTGASSGSYVAMEDTASLVRLGMSQGAAAQDLFFKGKIALLALSLGALSPTEVGQVAKLCDAFFDLAIS